MKRLRYIFPSPHVTRPQPGLEYSMIMLTTTALVALIALMWSAMTGQSLSPLSWYIVRGSGFSLYLLSWFIMVSGLGTTTKVAVNTGNRGLAMSVHAFAFHLWYGVLLLHILSVAIDPAVNFNLVNLIVPFTSGWREPWTGFGIFAAELGLLVGASGAIRRLLGYRAWKALHWLSLPMFALGLFHGLFAGTDGSTTWAFALYLITTAWVIFLTIFRLLGRNTRASRRGDRMPPEPYRTRLLHGQHH